MKTSFQKISFPLFFSFTIIVFCFFHPYTLSAQKDKDGKKVSFQELIKSYTEEMSKYDTTAFETGFFLKRGLFDSRTVEKFRKPLLNKKGITPITATKKEWFSIYESLKISDVRKQKLDKSTGFIPSIMQSDNGMVPVGIMNIQGNSMTDAQEKIHKENKANGKKVDGKDYEKISFIMASVLRDVVYRGDITLDISPKRYFKSSGKIISDMRVDFMDGQLAIHINPEKNQTIKYQYKTIGKKTICFHIRLSDGTELRCFAEIVIKNIDLPKFQSQINFEATSVKSETTKNSRATASIVGATARVVLGCDGVLDKPIIIFEGYDYDGRITLDEMQGRYLGTFERMRNSGYDIVFVNWNDPKDWLQNNAEVAKGIIRQIRRLRSGNHPHFIVIGESMGGIIARMALRQMENAGETHSVSHYISFDAPHRGANVPVGVSTLAKMATGTINAALFNWFGNDDVGSLYELVSNADSPAAKQLILYNPYVYPLTFQTQRPEFGQFQTYLQQLGYPQNVQRRVAIVNGSLINTPQTGINGQAQFPGSLIYKKSTWGIFSAEAHSVVPSVNTEAAWLYMLTFLIIPSWASESYNLNIVPDLSPGGWSDEIAIEDADAGRNYRFSFAPTYSTIDFQGPISNTPDIFLTDARNAPTPFQRIYGDNINNRHVRVFEERFAWFDLFQTEFGIGETPIPTTTLCTPSSPTPPLPLISSNAGFNICASNNQVCFNADLGEYPGMNLTYFWYAVPLWSSCTYPLRPFTNFNSSQWCVNSSMFSRGIYQIYCRISYTNRPNDFTLTSQIYSFNNGCIDGSTGACGSLTVMGEGGMQNIGSTGGVTNITVNADNVNWSIVNSPSWISLSPPSGGNGANNVSSNFQTNPSSSPRSTNLVVQSSSGPSVDIYASQQGGSGGSTSNSCISCQGTTYNHNQTVGYSGGGTRAYISIEGGCAKVRWDNSENSNVYQDWIWVLQNTSFSIPQMENCLTWEARNNCGNNSACGSSGGSGGGGSLCSYTNGEYMTTWFGDEVIRAYVCGTKYYAKNDAGFFKSRSWLVGTGRFTTAETDCFEEVNPGCGGLRIAAVQTDEIDKNITVYPNPTTGKIKIIFSLQKAENVWLNLYDVQGKSLDLRDFEGKLGRNEMEYDLQNYPSGAYFVNFQSSEKREVLKVMKVN